MKKKHFYEKPSMQIFELKQRTMLLAGSNCGGELTSMDDPEDLE